ncbi:hypothetical protein IKN40_00255 [bacterium]|nr:hypothetical protein [bacterium]
MNTQKTTFMNRKAIEKEAMKRFGMCQYVDTITPSPKADGKRFVRTYWTKNHSKPVAKLYIYEATGKVYLKDMLKNETISNVHSSSEWQASKSSYTQIPLW